MPNRKNPRKPQSKGKPNHPTPDPPTTRQSRASAHTPAQNLTVSPAQAAPLSDDRILPDQSPSGVEQISPGHKRGFDEVTNSDEEFREEGRGILRTVSDSEDSIQATVPPSQSMVVTRARKKNAVEGHQDSRRQDSVEEETRNNIAARKQSSRPSNNDLRNLRQLSSRQAAPPSTLPNTLPRTQVRAPPLRAASQSIVTPIATQHSHGDELVTPLLEEPEEPAATQPVGAVASSGSGDIVGNQTSTGGRRVLSGGGEERIGSNPDLEVSRQAQRMNNYKTQIAELTVALRTEKVLNTAVTEQVARLNETVARLEQENESLRTVATITEPAVTEEVEAGRSVQRSKQKRYEMKVPIRFLGIASSIERSILGWCHRETMELVPVDAENTREWNGRSHSVTTYGYSTGVIEGGSTRMFVPFAPWDAAGKGDYFISLYENEMELIGAMVRNEFNKEKWSALYPSDALRKECVEEVSKDRGLRNRARQMLSDCVGGRKRNARDKLLQFLGYSSLVSRSPKPRTTEEMEDKRRQKEEVLEKLISIQTTAGIPDDLSCWRTTDIQSLAYSKWQVPFSLTEKRTEDQLFRHPFAIDVLHDFRGYAIRDGEREMESSIMLLARLDAWVATVVFCFNDTVGQGGKRQRQFQHIYSKLLPVAVQQLLQHVYGIVQSQVSNELVLILNEEERGDRFGNDRRRATTILSAGKPNQFYLAVDQKWFSDFVSSAMGSILDCYIGQTSDDGRLELLDVEGNRIESYPDGDPARDEYPSPSLRTQGGGMGEQVRGREFEDTENVEGTPSP